MVDLGIGIRKYGRNPDVDGAEDIWSQGGNYTFLTVASTLYISSTEVADTQQIEVQGLDENWDVALRTVALNGQNQVALPGKWIRVYRAKVVGLVAVTGSVYIAEQDTLTAGVPNTASKIKAKIDVNFQQSLMCIYTIPRGHRGILLAFDVGFIPNTTNAQYCTGALLSREFGSTFLVKEYFGLLTAGTSRIHHTYKKPVYFGEKSDVLMRILTVSAVNQDIYAGFEIDLEEV